MDEKVGKVLEVAFYPLPPDVGGGRMVGNGTGIEECSLVVSVLKLDWSIAVSTRQRKPIVDPVISRHETGTARGPAVLLLGPVEISLVSCIRAKPSGEEQEPRARELVVVQIVEGGIRAAADATVALARGPSAYLVIEDRLGQVKPFGLISRGIRELTFGGGKGDKAPRGDIVVVLMACVKTGVAPCSHTLETATNRLIPHISGEEVSVFPYPAQYAFANLVVKLIITREEPIV